MGDLGPKRCGVEYTEQPLLSSQNGAWPGVGSWAGFYPSHPTGHHDSPPTLDFQGWFVLDTCFSGAPAHPRTQVGAGLLASLAAGFILQSEPPFWASPEINPSTPLPGG